MTLQWIRGKSCFRNRIKCGQILNEDDTLDPILFLQKCKLTLIFKVGEFIHEYRSSVKINCDLACEYVIVKNGQEQVSEIFHKSKMGIVSLSDDFDVFYDENISQPIRNKLDEFQERDSGKALKRILYMQINIFKYCPLDNVGSSYLPLPKNIVSKKAIINVQNYDQKCFVWSILSALFPVVKNPHIQKNYPQNYENILKLNGINFPMPLCDIHKFERQNDISINVYTLDFDKKLNRHVVVGPIHFTKNKKEQHINLLYLTEGEKSHYMWIKSLSRLLNSQLSKNRNKKWICDRCLQYFANENLLRRHDEDCSLMNPTKITLPSDDQKWLEFSNFKYKITHPFIVYCDMECLTIPIHSCEPNIEKSYIRPYQKHEPCAIAIQFVCSYDKNLSFFDYYRGSNAIAWFLEKLDGIANNVANIYENIVDMNSLTQQQWHEFNMATRCHICSREFDVFDENLRKVRDHDHRTGIYRGPAHNSCNLNYKDPHYIPIFFHNLSNYDGHLFIEELAVKDSEKNITLIPNNEEKYISFSKHTKYGITLRFLDSLK